MTDAEFAYRAAKILHNMALERTGWRSFFVRWVMYHEPLRHDAANLLRSRGAHFPLMNGTRLVGDD